MSLEDTTGTFELDCSLCGSGRQHQNTDDSDPRLASCPNPQLICKDGAHLDSQWL